MPKLYFQTIEPELQLDNILLPMLTTLSTQTCDCPATCLYDIVNELTKGADYQLKYDDRAEHVQYLQNELNDCRNKGKGYGLANFTMDIENSAIIREEYIRYIIKYGVPEDGLFLPSLLNECMCDCD